MEAFIEETNKLLNLLQHKEQKIIYEATFAPK